MTRRRLSDDPAEPILLIELELAGRAALTRVSATQRAYTRARALVRVHGAPVGVLDLDSGPPFDVAELRERAWSAHRAAIASALGRADLSRAPPQPSVTIVIATRGRTTKLAATLDSVWAVDYPDYEVVVVDNDPVPSATRALVEHLSASERRLRYIHEPRPGLAIAHNAGLRIARGDIVAFTDDDVLVDERWLLELARAFAWRDDIVCVTGLIAPAELETGAQLWLEDRVQLDKGYEPRVFNTHADRPAGFLFPYAAGAFGSGANMAFRTGFLNDAGGFDAAMGAGTRSRGGDDLAAFFAVLSSGASLAYQPAAIVRHFHRRDVDGLRRQMFDYGAGLGAYLTKIVVDRPSRVVAVGWRVPFGARRAMRARSDGRGRRRSALDRHLTRLEWAGMAAGPAGYLLERRTRSLERRRSPRGIPSA
jgi:glycosyltransferase involved in cell wall biosynthesis